MIKVTNKHGITFYRVQIGDRGLSIIKMKIKHHWTFIDHRIVTVQDHGQVIIKASSIDRAVSIVRNHFSK